jgi:hypothetical protein
MGKEKPLNVLWTWLDWLHVEHHVIQRINYLLTPLLAAVVAVSIWLLPISLNIFGEFGLFYHINGLVQILAGFFIASLAAVATFSRDGLDDIMGGDPPTIPRSSGRPEDLTRRRFLCLLFGFLAGGSIVLYLAGAIAMLAAPLVHDWGLAHATLHRALRSAIGFVYGMVLCNVLLTSFLGLYFLIDRIHQPNTSSGFVKAAPSPKVSRADDQ